MDSYPREYGQAHTWFWTGKHCPGTVLRKKARRKGFKGCIQTVLDGPVKQRRRSSSRAELVLVKAQVVLLSWWRTPSCLGDREADQTVSPQQTTWKEALQKESVRRFTLYILEEGMIKITSFKTGETFVTSRWALIHRKWCLPQVHEGCYSTSGKVTLDPSACHVSWWSITWNITTWKDNHNNHKTITTRSADDWIMY